MTLTPEQEAILRAMVEDARWDVRELHRIVGGSPLAKARADALEAALTEITELRARVEAINAHVPTHGLWRCDCCDGLYAGANCSSYPRCPNASATGAGPEEIAAAWAQVDELAEAARGALDLIEYENAAEYRSLTRALAPFDEEGT